LGVSKEQLFSIYIAAFSSGTVSARGIAAQSLGDLGDKRAIEPLLEMLKAEEVPSLAAEALTKLGSSSEVIDFYLSVLSCQPRPDRNQYSKIFDYFVNVRAGRAVYPLINLIHQPKPGSENFYKDILKTIGKIGDENAVAPLNQLLNATWKWVTVGKKGKQEEVKQTDSEWIREDIIAALQMINQTKCDRS